MNRIKASSLVISVLGLLGAAPAGATPLSYSTGLANPVTTLDFGGASIGTDVSNLYAAQGVTFGGLFASNNGIQASSVPPAASNYLGAVLNPTFTISFLTPQTDAAFFLYTDGFGATVTSSLSGSAVESTVVGQYDQAGADYFGFTGSSFDTITVTVGGDQTATIDNIEFGAAALPVPEPGSNAILVAGLAGLMVVGGRRRI